MINKTSLLKKFLLSAEWDRAFAVVEDDGKTQNNSLTSEDYADFAYARCFQSTRNHNDGNYDDVIADASKALIKDCDDIRTRCIRAYGYYLNCNYDDAIIDCDKIIKAAEQAQDAAEQAKKAATAATNTQAAADAQADYCAALQNAVFAYELLGMIYTGMDGHLEASRNYKLAMLARQSPCTQTCNSTDIAMPGPLLMDAYRNARKAVKVI
jgi:tetratricopeptide (TPR) repeat protein